jgi:hypothetical protein
MNKNLIVPQGILNNEAIHFDDYNVSLIFATLPTLGSTITSKY